MSGFDGTGGPISPGSTCESLIIDTLLASPRQDVIGNLRIGDFLEVSLGNNDVGQRVVEVRLDGRLAGGLASPAVGRLRECLEGGTRYQARVTGKRDALVRVRVAAVRQ